jgi:fumarate reductase (CoM/CoB) subunit A
MWEGAGIFRNAADLNKTLDTIGHLSHSDIRAESSRNLAECCIVRNMCLTASLICRSALIRQETRGAHVRTDIKQIHDAQHSPFGHTYLSLFHEGIEQKGAGT